MAFSSPFFGKKPGNACGSIESTLDLNGNLFKRLINFFGVFWFVQDRRAAFDRQWTEFTFPYGEYCLRDRESSSGGEW